MSPAARTCDTAYPARFRTPEVTLRGRSGPAYDKEEAA